MVSDGYTITQHLYANGTGADGSLYYNGQLSKDGSNYDYFIIVCKDSATADSHFSDGASCLQALGFSGSCNSDSTVWSGTTNISRCSSWRRYSRSCKQRTDGTRGTSNCDTNAIHR